MNDELDIVVENILTAEHPEDVFGKLGDTQGEQRKRLKMKFHQLSRAVHPDAHPEHTDKAEKAFQVLAALRTKALKSIEGNAYGAPKPAAVISTKTHTYGIYSPIATVGNADYYKCVVDENNVGIFAVSKTPKKNSAIVNEAKILQKLFIPSFFASLLPTFIETFVHEQDGVHRQVNTFYHDIRYLPLSEVIAAKTWDPKDMAWIWRRLLDVLGYAHSQSVIHGNVVPSNILIGLKETHNVILMNWQNALDKNVGYIPSINTTYRDLYPKEVFAKEHPTPSVDIYMSAKCMLMMMDRNQIPRSIEGFLQSCLFPDVKYRLQDAWRVRTEFTDLIERLWGKRIYRPLYLP